MSSHDLFIVISVCSVKVNVRIVAVQGGDLFTYALVPLDRPDHNGNHRAFGWLNVDNFCEVVSRP